jgi:hypothetical protein
MLHNITLVHAWNQLDTEHHYPPPPPPAKIAASLIALSLSSPYVQVDALAIDAAGGWLDVTSPLFKEFGIRRLNLQRFI